MKLNEIVSFTLVCLYTQNTINNLHSKLLLCAIENMRDTGAVNRHFKVELKPIEFDTFIN